MTYGLHLFLLMLDLYAFLQLEAVRRLSEHREKRSNDVERSLMTKYPHHRRCYGYRRAMPCTMIKICEIAVTIEDISDRRRISIVLVILLLWCHDIAMPILADAIA